MNIIFKTNKKDLKINRMYWKNNWSLYYLPVGM